MGENLDLSRINHLMNRNNGSNGNKDQGKGQEKRKPDSNQLGKGDSGKGSFKKNFSSAPDRDYKGKKGNKDNVQSTSYVGAPYNFVPLADHPVRLTKKDQIAHNTMQRDLISGEITYKITAKSPIFVSDGGKKDKDGKTYDEQFYKDKYNRIAIPGSTVRGLVRSNAQILSLSSVADDIDDYRMMFRNVTSGANKDLYGTMLGSGTVKIDDKKVSVLKKVKAGYLVKKKGQYKIFPTVIDKIDERLGAINYYLISERIIIDAKVDGLPEAERFRFFFEEGGRRLQHKFFKKFKKEPAKDRRTGKEIPNKFIYTNTVNDDYKPYYEPISYNVSGTRTVTAVGAPGLYDNEGYVISTGSIRMKKVIYIIPNINMATEGIPIPDRDLKAFEIDLKKREKGLKPLKFFALPEEGETKPVFYFEGSDCLYFGFTPRLRLFNKYSIKAGMTEEQKKAGLDYSKVIFGYSTNENSYKSRVSFADAVRTKDVKDAQQSELLLSEPKASSFADYLEQPENSIEKTYNSESFSIRGIKEYWLHEDLVPQFFDKDKRKLMLTKIKPLGKGTEFTGKVRFHNLKKEELGLLLWSLRLNKDSWQNIGKGKPLGYGAIKVDILGIKEVSRKKAFEVDFEALMNEKKGTALELDVFDGVDSTTDSLIEFYKKSMSERSKEFDKEKSVNALFSMKDSKRIPSNAGTRYMDIDKKEYQSRKRPLPSIEKVMEDYVNKAQGDNV